MYLMLTLILYPVYCNQMMSSISTLVDLWNNKQIIIIIIIIIIIDLRLCLRPYGSDAPRP